MNTRTALVTVAAVAATLGPNAAAQPQGHAADFAALAWRSIGPLRGGRSLTAAGSARRPNEYYFGATGGGVWKTVDGGVTWAPVTDRYFKTSSPGALAVSPSNPDVVYVGMGETELRNTIIQGDGVYKTTDGGKTWTSIGLSSTQAISRIRIHPTNPDIVFVAAFGDPYGPSPDRGIFRSGDGGKTWQKVLYRNDRVGASDLVIDPSNPDVMYAALWEAYRTPYSLVDGGTGGGLFKSTDGGLTWIELTKRPGLPTSSLLGKITLAVGPHGQRVYAMVEARDGGLYRSDDAGQTWTLADNERRLWQRAFYFTRMTADPQNADVLYVMNFDLLKSADGGRTFTKLPDTHGDHHDLWIAPDDPRRMIDANDGGASVSTTGGHTWTSETFPTAQMYHVATTADVPYQVCGAQQDTGTACMDSTGQGDQFYDVGGGESGYVAPDPRNPDIFYAGSFGGFTTRFDRSRQQKRFVNVWPEYPVGQAPRDLRERFQWTFPLLFSPVDPRILYTSSQHLWKTTDGGQTWTAISPDLTRHDPGTLGPSGGPIAYDQTGAETYATIFTVAPSRKDPNTIWTGSDDGLVHVTRDGGRSWTDVTPKDLPAFSRISLIEASPHAAGRAYIAANHYEMSDRAPYVYRTDDYGASWTKITGGIAAGDFARAIREDPVRAGLLYLGTECGIYISFDDGARWEPFRLNLPVTPVRDIAVHGDDLIIATHGRGFYVLDGIGILRQLGPTPPSSLTLFTPGDATRSVSRGVPIDYFLPASPAQMTLQILDAGGRVVRTIAEPPPPEAGPMPAGVTESSRAPVARLPVKAGMNRFVWDMRADSFHDFPGLIMYQASTRGPIVPPGHYQVRLTASGRTRTAPLRILKDPRATDVTEADLLEQYRFAEQIGHLFSDTSDMILRIRQAKADAHTSSAQAAALTAIEGTLYQYRNRATKDPLNFPPQLNNKIGFLLGEVSSGDGRPTAAAYAVYKQLAAAVDVQRRALDQLLGRAH
ncbi:MAG TPA: hypothetical protein VFX12_11695 [Vicinamibacterales bacterium]|nr:hypothetical protein [Vicinamibacterales bacterium]